MTKILCMKDCGNSFHGKHLKAAIDYIMAKEKTQNGKFVAGYNCQPDYAFEQMKKTKNAFGKLDKRQGYHLILSFVKGEADAETAFMITEQFVKKYLGEEYEAVYAVHDNTEHIHSHIVFNSVSFRTGRKFRYEKGDWAKEIQPLTNQLCEQYGLSTLQMEQDGLASGGHEKEWREYKDGRFVWSQMIKRDFDACILQAKNFESFIELLTGKGYEIKQGKYLAVKPPGMGRYKRCKSFGEEYTEERIKERIFTEQLSICQPIKRQSQQRIQSFQYLRLKKRKLTGIQKRYFARLYKLGRLKKKPYSKAWKYKEDIKKMQNLQEQYLFLARHNMKTVPELAVMVQNLTDKKKEISKERSSVWKERSKYNSFFQITDEMKQLSVCENSFQAGDHFFLEEHKQWMQLEERLSEEKYTKEEVEALRESFQSKMVLVREKEKTIRKEINLAKSIIKEMVSDFQERKINSKKKEQAIEEIQLKKQPKR